MDRCEALTTITAWYVQSFVWENIICRFGLPHTVITNNDRQFINRKLAEFYKELGIKSITSFVEHPTMNDRADVMNKTIVIELKRILGEAKGSWVDKLPQWA